MNIKTMLKTMGIGAVIFLMLSAFPLFAQDEFENEPPFIRELALSLAARGWTVGDLDALVTAGPVNGLVRRSSGCCRGDRVRFASRDWKGRNRSG